MKPFGVTHRVTRALMVSDPDWMRFVPQPPDPWYFRSPRGGYHVAIGPVITRTAEDFETGDMLVGYRSADSRYLRPRTGEWQRAHEALA